jgi:hypothetical protein
MIMVRRAWVLFFTVGIVFAISGTHSFAQIGGRGGIGGIFGGAQRGGRGERGAGTQNEANRVERPIQPDPNSYEQTEHRLLLLEAELHLNPDQQKPWQAFAQKVLAYASDLSHERVLAGIPVSEGTAVSGLQHIDQATDSARHRVSELEDIRAAANSLYKTFLPDQKKIADTRIVTIIAPRLSVPTGGDVTNNSSDPGFGGTKARH